MKKTYIAVIIALTLALFSVSTLAEETANHILTVYFSVAENSEVDVSSAASVTQWNGNAVGTISVLANMIHDHVGGDLYSIDTSVEYPVFVFFQAGRRSLSNNTSPSCLVEFMLNCSPAKS